MHCMSAIHHMAPGQGGALTGHTSMGQSQGSNRQFNNAICHLGHSYADPIQIPDNGPKQGGRNRMEVYPWSQHEGILQGIQEHIELKLWQQAAAHRHGQELMPSNKAPDLHSIRSQYNSMLRKGRMADAALLVTITAVGHLAQQQDC